MEDRHPQVDEGVILAGLTSSEVLLLVKFLPQTYRRGVRKVRIKMPGKAISSFLKPLSRAAESECEVSLERGGRLRRVFR